MADGPGLVTVEFYGVPRQRAGRAELAVAARTVGEMLEAVERACPRLAGHYLLSIDGRQFTSDLEQELQPGDRVLLLSADAGG